MEGCLVYPGVYSAGLCESCDLFSICDTKGQRMLAEVHCKNCNFSCVLYDDFAKSATVVCPICKEIMS